MPVIRPHAVGADDHLPVDDGARPAAPEPDLRFTGSFSDFRANELNNLGGVISRLSNKDIGRELLFVSEHTLSRAVYIRVTQGTLWPGSGVRGTLPAPVARPWLVGIASLNIQY